MLVAMNAEQQPGPATPPPAGQPTEPHQPQGQAAWGAPPPPPEQRRRWSTRRIVVTVAVAVGIAAAGGVAIYVAGGSTPKERGLVGGPGGGGPVIMGGPMSELDHGEFQNGEVTEISDTSITAKSEDGYERTYTIDEGTQLGGDIEKGDEVMIMASVDGDTATAESVVDQGELMDRRSGDGGGPPPIMRN
jgi:hypothetical protein